MFSNLKKYKEDLKNLTEDGDKLLQKMYYEVNPEGFLNQLTNQTQTDKDKVKKYIAGLPEFNSKYQSWYSESLAIIKLLLPDRLSDFIRLYEKPKSRKEIEYGNYVLEDYLLNLTIVTRFGEKKIGPEAAIPQFKQQLNILKSVERRFESSLFDIKQLVQADLFDTELEAAKELNRNKFFRAGGAICGVVLENHLHQVCDNHSLNLTKKNPTINDFNELLKQNNVIDVIQWRFIQHLADIRNLCDHDKKTEPSSENITDMVSGVEKVTKTIF